MKKYSRYLLTLVAAVAFALALKLPAQASVTITSFKQSTCTANTVTVSWGNPSITNGETITSFDVATSNGSASVTVNASARSATLNVPTNYVGNVYLYANYKTKSNYTSYDWDYTGCNTVPTAPTKTNAALAGMQSSTGKVEFGAARNDYSHGTQVQLFKGNKLVKTINFNSYSDFIKVAKGAAYQYRARFYYANKDNGKTYYSGWGPWHGFVWSKQATFRYGYGMKGYTIIMKKATGVKKYTVKYATSYDATKFKKVKTFKAQNKKSYKIRVTKRYKKKGTNYVRVYPYIKLKWFKGTSEIYITGTPYPYK